MGDRVKSALGSKGGALVRMGTDIDQLYALIEGFVF